MVERAHQPPRAERAVPVRHGLRHILAFLTGSAAVVSIVASFFQAGASATVLAVYLVTFLAIVAPGILRPTGFGSWEILVLSAIPAVLLRGIYLAVLGPSDPVTSVLGAPSDLRQIALPGLELSLGLFLFVLGLQSARSSGPSDPTPKLILSFGLTPPRVRRVSFVLLIVSLSLFVLFVRSTGGFDVSNLSAKRAVFLNSETAGLQNLYRTGSSVLRWVPLIFLSSYGRGRLPVWARATFVVMALIAMLPPIYSSSRADLLFVPLSIFTYSRLTNRRIRLSAVVATLLIVGILVAATTQLRGSRDDDINSLSFGLSSLVETVAINRNFSDPVKQTLMRDVVTHSGIINGESYLGVVSAPVPRAVWAGKPEVNSGPRFARDIYGFQTTGVPPGGITELMWNFGILGLTFAPLVGIAFGSLDRWLRSSLHNGAIVYAAIFVLLPTQFVGAGFSQSTIGVAIEVAVTLVLLTVSGARVRRVKV